MRDRRYGGAAGIKVRSGQRKSSRRLARHSCPLRDYNAWKNHVIRHHPGKLAYPGSTPSTTLKILQIIEDRERNDRTTTMATVVKS